MSNLLSRSSMVLIGEANSFCKMRNNLSGSSVVAWSRASAQGWEDFSRVFEEKNLFRLVRVAPAASSAKASVGPSIASRSQPSSYNWSESFWGWNFSTGAAHTSARQWPMHARPRPQHWAQPPQPGRLQQWVHDLSFEINFVVEGSGSGTVIMVGGNLQENNHAVRRKQPEIGLHKLWYFFGFLRLFYV